MQEGCCYDDLHENSVSNGLFIIFGSGQADIIRVKLIKLATTNSHSCNEVMELEEYNILRAFKQEAASNPQMRFIEKHSDYISVELKSTCAQKSTFSMYRLFPGVIVNFHDLNITSMPAYNGEIASGLKLNFCIDGRCELNTCDGIRFFLEPDDFCICFSQVKDVFSFPGGHYRGVEIYVHESELINRTCSIFCEMGLDAGEICSRLCGNKSLFFHKGNGDIKRLFLAMRDPPAGHEISWLKIKLAELFILLSTSGDLLKEEPRRFYTASQVEMAKQVMQIVSEDLSARHSIETLAGRYDISTSSLKSYFKGVYGKSISEHLKAARMSAAASALQGTTINISEIASSVGYENASKFTAAFKVYSGVTPLEYRRQTRCIL